MAGWSYLRRDSLFIREASLFEKLLEDQELRSGSADGYGRSWAAESLSLSARDSRIVTRPHQWSPGGHALDHLHGRKGQKLPVRAVR